MTSVLITICMYNICIFVPFSIEPLDDIEKSFWTGIFERKNLYFFLIVLGRHNVFLFYRLLYSGSNLLSNLNLFFIWTLNLKSKKQCVHISSFFYLGKRFKIWKYCTSLFIQSCGYSTKYGTKQSRDIPVYAYMSIIDLSLSSCWFQILLTYYSF